jgi:hypothetical protein
MGSEMERAAHGSGPGSVSGSAITQPTSTSNANIKPIPERAQDGQAVYLHGSLIGFVIGRRHGSDAVTAAGVGLGRFNDDGAAFRALLQRAVPQDSGGRS